MANEIVVTIVGNLTGDPELKVLQGGASLASFTIASTPRSFDKASGEWRDGSPLFLRCTAWRQLADHITDSLTRGARVIATGRLSQRSYEKNGAKHTVIEMEVEEIGPSLKFATATVNRSTWEGSESRGNGGRATSKAGRGGDESDQPPF